MKKTKTNYMDVLQLVLLVVPAVKLAKKIMKDRKGK